MRQLFEQSDPVVLLTGWARILVGIDARVTVAGTAYEVAPQLAGEVVLLLWGLFDDALYVEYEGARSGPYFPVSGPIPLHRYRAFKRGKREERADHGVRRQVCRSGVSQRSSRSAAGRADDPIAQCHR